MTVIVMETPKGHMPISLKQKRKGALLSDVPDVFLFGTICIYCNMMAMACMPVCVFMCISVYTVDCM